MNDTRKTKSGCIPSAALDLIGTSEEGDCCTIRIMQHCACGAILPNYDA